MKDYYFDIKSKITESTKHSDYSVYIPKEAMKTMTYKNRYGDIITATKIDDNYYKLAGFSDLVKTEFDKNPNDIIFIDFSGGPMINVGDNLGNWFNELKGKIVKSIKFDKEVIIEV